MANAIILPPVQPTGGFGVYGGPSVGGEPAHLFNDYAGVTWAQELGLNGTSYEAGVYFDWGRDVSIDTMLVFGIEGLIDRAIALFTWTEAQGDRIGTPASFSGAIAGSEPLNGGRAVVLALAGTPVVGRYCQVSFYSSLPGVVRAARIVAGRRIQLERNFAFGATFGVRDLGSLDFTRRGVLQRARGKKLRTVGLTFSNIRKDEVEAQTRPLLERIGNTEMVGLVTDPAADAQRQNRCYFGPLVGELSHTWRKANAFEAKTNLVSIF